MRRSDVSLDETEQKAQDDLWRCYSTIKGWGLLADETELITAIHLIQGFIIQHMLQRLNPDAWAQWYGEADA